MGCDVLYWSTIHAPSGEQRIGPTAVYLLSKRPCRVIIETAGCRAGPTAQRVPTSRAERRFASVRGPPIQDDASHVSPSKLSPLLASERPSRAAGILAMLASVAAATVLVYSLKQIHAGALARRASTSPAVLVVSTFWGLSLGIAHPAC